MSLVLIAYLVVRMGYFHIAVNPLGERETGLWLEMLSPDEQIRRFAANPWPLYGYTASSSFLNVLISQPVLGQWTVVNAYRSGELHPLYVLEMMTSIVATILIVWHGYRRRDPMVVVMIGALSISALLSYAYAKNEIMSAAGVIYALAAYASAAELLRVLTTKPLKWSAAPIVCGFVDCSWA